MWLKNQRAEMHPQRHSSLRQLLTRWVVLPLVMLLAASLAATWLIALDTANDAYDSQLLDPALAIANNVMVQDGTLRFELPPIALEVLRVDAADRLFFEVLASDGSHAVGNGRIRPPAEAPLLHQHLFYDSLVDGRPVRVAALRAGSAEVPILVLVAETYVKRDRLVKEMLIATGIPATLLALAAFLFSWFGIRRVLQPLDNLRDEIAARSPRDLGPVSESSKPGEIRPLVRTLNQLFSRMQAAIDNQQRFIENAAHQLRTPIAGLATHSELARRREATPELRDLLDMIASETRRTSHLINQLLTLARAEPGDLHAIERQPLDLHALASQAAQQWVPRALAQNMDLGFELEHAWTIGDPLLLRELLANLLDNALAYGKRPSPDTATAIGEGQAPDEGGGGNITVRTRSEADMVVLEVEDDGPGIPQADRAQVLERFYRRPGTPGDGSGLGLAIVAEIARRHQATLALLTPASGRGLLVRLQLKPLALPDRPAG